jgi:hypothetical protein
MTGNKGLVLVFLLLAIAPGNLAFAQGENGTKPKIGSIEEALSRFQKFWAGWVWLPLSLGSQRVPLI